MFISLSEKNCESGAFDFVTSFVFLFLKNKYSNQLEKLENRAIFSTVPRNLGKMLKRYFYYLTEISEEWTEQLFKIFNFVYQQMLFYIKFINTHLWINFFQLQQIQHPYNKFLQYFLMKFLREGKKCHDNILMVFLKKVGNSELTFSIFSKKVRMKPFHSSSNTRKSRKCPHLELMKLISIRKC